MMVWPSPQGDSSTDKSSSGEEMAPFSLGTAGMLAAGDLAASSPPASTGECGALCFHLARTVSAFQLHDSIGRHHRCTWCCGIQVHEDADILVAEALEATSEGCQHGIHQLSCYSLPNRHCNFVGGRKAGAQQCQPFGRGSSVNVRQRSSGSDKLICFS